MKERIVILLIALFCSTAIAQEQNALYNIGDRGPGGGYVFYYSEAGFPVYESDNARPVICHYLECSPDEVGNSASWCPCRNGNWCDVKPLDGVGAGRLNTKRILNSTHYNAGFLTSTSCAAYACNNYFTKATKAGEWYLPSKFELNLMYENLRKNGKITGDAWHWSSSRGDFHNAAWAQRFGDGFQDNLPNFYRGKYSNNVVRAVRAF